MCAVAVVLDEERACAPEAAPEAGLEHAVGPEVVVKDAGRPWVRQDIRVALHPKQRPKPKLVPLNP